MAKEENKFNFDRDERVLCYHGPFIYEAKILKRDKKEDQDDQEENQYFVHYKGWKQTWDEWVTEDRVLKYTEANLQKQKQLKESNLKRKSSRASVSASQTPENTTEPRGRKRYRDSSIDKTRMDDDTKRFKLPMPDTLKGLLVDDWENITKNRQMLTLPREVTVEKILEDFREQCPIKDEGLEEFIQGILLYFNKMIGTSLLYRSERKQFEELCIDKEPSSVYGPEHLLRLFVEMPGLISATNIDADTMLEVKERLEDLLRFVQDHEKDYFPSDYAFETQ